MQHWPAVKQIRQVLMRYFQ